MPPTATLALFLGFVSYGFGQNPQSHCPQFWKQYFGSCYALIHNASPWAAAEEICRDFNAYLVEVDDDDENNFLTNWILKENPSQQRYWMGGTDLLSEDNWMWSHSEQSVQFTNWSPGNPSNSAHNENCMEFIHYNTTYMWNDNKCSASQYFICEMAIPTNPAFG